METKKVTFRNLDMLERMWSLYLREGWRVKRPVECKWSWRRLDFVYELIIEREEPVRHSESVENKSEINTHQFIFRYTANNGNEYEKSQYADPNTFVINHEFDKWKTEMEINSAKK